MEGISPGTMAGAGLSPVRSAASAIALHELDEIPACPRCEGRAFRRTAMFGRETEEHPTDVPAESPPAWVARGPGGAGLSRRLPGLRARRAHACRTAPGRLDARGPSLSAHVRFDDPTVSRRHALVYSDDEGSKALDDRSLNGLFVNGEQVDMRDLADGDELEIGRFRLYYLSLPAAPREERDRMGAGVGYARRARDPARPAPAPGPGPRDAP